jgi:hypothetical protein
VNQFVETHVPNNKEMTLKITQTTNYIKNTKHKNKKEKNLGIVLPDFSRS